MSAFMPRPGPFISFQIYISFCMFLQSAHSTLLFAGMGKYMMMALSQANVYSIWPTFPFLFSPTVYHSCTLYHYPHPTPPHPSLLPFPTEPHVAYDGASETVKRLIAAFSNIALPPTLCHFKLMEIFASLVQVSNSFHSVLYCSTEYLNWKSAESYLCQIWNEKCCICRTMYQIKKLSRIYKFRCYFKALILPCNS